MYKSLSDDPEHKKAGQWQLKPKFHLFAELAEEQSMSLGNPKDFWAYKDESFMGVVATRAASRGGGGSAQTVPLKTMERYMALCEDGLDSPKKGKNEKPRIIATQLLQFMAKTTVMLPKCCCCCWGCSCSCYTYIRQNMNMRLISKKCKNKNCNANSASAVPELQNNGAQLLRGSAHIRYQ